MSLLENANLGLSFLLELCAMAAFAYWGFQASSALVIKVALAIVAPLLAIMLWSVIAAPKAPRRLKGWQLLVFKLLFFALAAAALWATHQPVLAPILAALVIINLGLGYVWGQK